MPIDLPELCSVGPRRRYADREATSITQWELLLDACALGCRDVSVEPGRAMWPTPHHLYTYRHLTPFRLRTYVAVVGSWSETSEQCCTEADTRFIPAHVAATRTLHARLVGKHAER